MTPVISIDEFNLKHKMMTYAKKIMDVTRLAQTAPPHDAEDVVVDAWANKVINTMGDALMHHPKLGIRARQRLLAVRGAVDNPFAPDEPHIDASEADTSQNKSDSSLSLEQSLAPAKHTPATEEFIAQTKKLVESLRRDNKLTVSPVKQNASDNQSQPIRPAIGSIDSSDTSSVSALLHKHHHRATRISAVEPNLAISPVDYSPVRPRG